MSEFNLRSLFTEDELRYKIIGVDFDSTVCMWQKLGYHGDTELDTYDYYAECYLNKNYHVENEQAEGSELMMAFLSMIKSKCDNPLVLCITQSGFSAVAEPKKRFLEKHYPMIFDDCVTVDSAKGKAFFLQALKSKLGYKSNQVLFIDDYWKAVDKARDLGMDAIEPPMIMEAVHQNRADLL